MSKLAHRSNPAALLSALMARGLTVESAAKTAGVDRLTLDRAIRGVKPLTVKVASKLVAAFGADVVTCKTPAQIELEQLTAMCAEFKARYPDDAARLAVLDEMIQDAKEVTENEV